ncbi:MAG: zinc ribbon domain-containing protein [Acidobacteriia bacterium]|jgi:hypothetical protein|nr:zinc ribbon domain-containing protein [Terriglobia bacterium]
MSRFREEIKIIPNLAWVIGFLLYAGLFLFLAMFVLRQEPEPAGWPLVAKAALAIVVPLPLFMFVLLIGYVYADAKRRRMNHVLWTLLAIFIPNGLGIILYFILRDPAPTPCPNCGMMTGKGFAFCPSCGFALAPRCPSCGRGVEAKWTYCGYCGTSLPTT